MRPGDVVADRFELLAIAGSGGMGTVYRARDRLAGDIVALKTLHSLGPRESARFARETALLAELAHPGIVRYVAHGVSADHLPFLAMEWVDGDTLQRRLQAGPLSVGEAIAVTRAIAEALAAAHRHGVVHRDIKPPNVMLAGGNLFEPKVLDFGIARDLAQLGVLTNTGVVMGTPGYMAPEQVRGETHAIDARTDVFALGCIFYRALTGVLAFAGESLAVLAKILIDEVPLPSSRRAEIPPEVDDLAMRMLAKSPEDRPVDGAAVAAELARLALLAGVRPAGTIVAGSGAMIGGREQGSHHGKSPAASDAFAATDLGNGPGADPDANPPASASPTHAATTHTSTRLAVAITDTELRLVSVVLAAAPGLVSDRLAPIATTFGGRAERISDGAALVLFSNVGAATDQAMRAARCALALREMLPQLATVVASGRAAVVGPVVGDAIDRAARALRGVAAGDIGLDDATRGLLDERFDIVALPPPPQASATTPATATGDAIVDDVFASHARLRGLRDGAEPARTLLGRHTPMVGRDRELATLTGLWADCVDEPRARAALVTAPAGAGKSRLRHELVRAIDPTAPPFGGADRGAQIPAIGHHNRDLDHRPQRPLVLVGRGDPVGAGSPFALLSDAIRRAAGVRDGDEPEVRRAALLARVRRTVADADADRVAHLLGEIAGVAFPSSAGAALRAARADAVAKGDAMRGAWVDWLAAECAAQPVLLVLEDLHWGDRPTLDYADAALRRLAGAPLLIVALARPEIHDRFPHLWRERDVQEIRLPALTRKAGEKLVRDVLGTRVDDAEVHRIVERSAGNALFLEELIRAVAEGRHELPDSVLAMLQHRLDALDPDSRRVLRAASVFGEVFWRGGIAALIGADPTAQLRTLVERELIAANPTSRLPGDHELGFRHDLVREAAYATMGDADRELAHRLAAEWLAAHGVTDALVLAGHFSRGGQPARAAEHYARAAEQANEGNDSVAALAHAASGLVCGATGELAGRLQLARAEAHNWRGEYAGCAEAAAAVLATVAPGSGGWFRAQDELFFSAVRTGDRARSLTVLQQLTTMTPVLGTETEQLRCISRAAIVMLRFGPPGAGTALAARVDQLAASSTIDFNLGQRVHTIRALVARSTGDADGAFASHAAAFELCRATHNDREMAFCLLAFGGAYLEIGALDQSIRTLERGIEVADRIGAGTVQPLLYMSRGLALQDLGDDAGACADARRAIAGTDPLASGLGHMMLARSLLEAADPDAALREATTACALVATFDEYAAMTLALRARIEVACRDVAGALAHVAEARRRMRPQDGFQEGEAAIRLVEIEVLEAAGRDAEAAAAARLAIDRLLARAERITPAWRQTFLAKPANAATLARR